MSIPDRRQAVVINTAVSNKCVMRMLSKLKVKSFIHRNIGVGTSTAAARIGSICSPFIVYTVSVNY